MKIKLIGHNFAYETEKVVRLFFPFEKMGEGEEIITEINQNRLGSAVYVSAFGKEERDFLTKDTENFEKETELCLARAIYRLLSAVTGITPKWGILTGVRPGKLMRTKVKELGEEGAKEYFSQTLLCDQSKIDLCLEAVKQEDKIISKNQKNWFSLYFSVPFCPTRCSYCSFVSHSVEKSMDLVEDYVTLLCKELEVTGQIAKDLNLSLATVYFGGGTPTTLSAEQLKRIFDTVKQSFDLSNLLEYNVEAGRPDTITKEKLKVILDAGATRISINPQTLSDKVLKAIGRNHTAEEAISAFKLARKCGADNINCDLIVGLPEDSAEGFSKTLDGILSLNPESITVHSLSMKRASTLTADGQNPDKEAGITASNMLSLLGERLPKKYKPYYLYRQSKTVGNLENVGYSVEGKEGLYNIYIMDETHTILACGASATTKLKNEQGDIERIYNFKYPYEYISRFDEMIKRKEGIYQFYGQTPQNKL